MTTPPSHWPDKAMSLAVTVFVIALLLYIAAKLIVAVLPVLIGMGIVAMLSRRRDHADRCERPQH